MRRKVREKWHEEGKGDALNYRPPNPGCGIPGEYYEGYNYGKHLRVGMKELEAYDYGT